MVERGVCVAVKGDTASATMSRPDGSVMAGESGGGQEEVSLGVKDTNALREKLGLKPLKLTNEKDDAMKARQKEQVDEDKKMEHEVDVEAKIDRMRNARKLNQEMEGPTLAQKLKSQGHKAATSSMADWVSHSRVLSTEQAQAAKRAAELDAQVRIVRPPSWPCSI